MAYTVELKRSAAKDILALDGATYERVREAIDALGDDPHPSAARKLRGHAHAWRLRVSQSDPPPIHGVAALPRDPLSSFHAPAMHPSLEWRA